MMLDEALSAFIVESRELLDHMEDALLRIEQAPDDAELINAIFRAAHTIKGTAGIFGLDGIVAFTHNAESVLELVRGGQLRIDAELASVLLASGDHVRQLVAQVAEGREPDATCLAQGQQLTERLRAALGLDSPAAASTPGSTPASTPATTPPTTPAAEATAPSAGTAAPPPSDVPHWHLSLRFGADTLREGFDPLSFVRYLNRLGTLQHVELLGHLVPRLAELPEAEACHLGLELALLSTSDQATLEQVFDFVRDGSQITVLPPGSPAQAYYALATTAHHADPAEPWDADVQAALQRCGSWPEAQPAQAAPAAQAAQAALVDLLADAATPATAAPTLDTSAPAQPEAPAELTQPPAAVSAEPTGPVPNAGRPAAGETQMLRVDAAKLDRLINLVGELLIAGAGAAQVARERRDKVLMQATSTVSRLMEEVRDSALSLRMVQIGATFNRFQRVVRDVSKEIGKDIALQICGAETELDKTVVERLADPLTHLVRNAIDHGVEAADRREAAGKPAQGTVTLNAYHEAGQVVIEVTDDGRGLSRDRIFQVAVTRGLIAADAQLSDQEVYQLIFQPGFSTAEQVSNISGRGVGMDVVARSITALRGTIDIDTVPGQGTTVRLRLPLTLAIIDGFLMGVGPSAYVVPLGAVVECIELTHHMDAGRALLDLRGEVLPIIRLRELYGVTGKPGRRQNVVVLRSGEQRVGLVVDQLMGELQTVIRPLDKVFQGVPGISGFTILGTGSVALLLDVAGLLKQAGSPGDLPALSTAHPTAHPIANSLPAAA